MPCIVVLKEKIVPFGKTLFMGGGGHSWVGHSKNLMSLGGQEEMSQVRKIPPAPPRDFINERSLKDFIVAFTDFTEPVCRLKFSFAVILNLLVDEKQKSCA